MSTTRPLLGQILVGKQWITEEQLSHGLTLQKSQRAPLGKILSGEGWLRHRQIRDALALQHQLPVVDLLKNPPQPGMINASHREEYQRLGIIPWKLHKNTVYIAITNLDQPTIDWINTHYPKYRLVLTSPLDVQRTLASHFAEEDRAEASYKLARNAPHLSAQKTFTPSQHFTIGLMLGIIAAGMIFAPKATFFFLCFGMQLVYLMVYAFKAILFAAGRHFAEPSVLYPILEDHQLPVYSVLVPLYREKACLPRLLNALRSLDYPKAKLDIKLVVEADDQTTIDALKNLQPESYFEIIAVPPGGPRTKPKALNYALSFARGELVTIFDAEDVPDPQQLRTAARMFAYPTVRQAICLQARLSYDNRHTNLLTRWFSLEYAAWFDHMLRGLERLSIPIPLGGTSNHIPRSVLEALGRWDAHNVTEDADLGMRLCLAGGRTLLLDSETEEEAPSRLSHWLAQRSRWIKGYMQTYLVYMRHPIRLFQRLGIRGFMGFQCFIGFPALVYLFAPPLWAITFCWASGILSLGDPLMDITIVTLGLFNLLLGAAVHWWQAVTSCQDRGWKGYSLAIATYPLYWFLHSLAGLRAFWQLLSKPHYWEKTPHGLDMPFMPPRKTGLNQGLKLQPIPA